MNKPILYLLAILGVIIILCFTLNKKVHVDKLKPMGNISEGKQIEIPSTFTISKGNINTNFQVGNVSLSFTENGVGNIVCRYTMHDGSFIIINCPSSNGEGVVTVTNLGLNIVGNGGNEYLSYVQTNYMNNNTNYLVQMRPNITGNKILIFDQIGNIMQRPYIPTNLAVNKISNFAVTKLILTEYGLIGLNSNENLLFIM